MNQIWPRQDGVAARMDALARRVAWELETLTYPARDWVRPLPGDALQVAIIGAGQAGLALAFALQRARIGPVQVIEALPEGASAVWTGFARMETLRTPKHVIGPEGGVPSLSVRAWYEARHGEAAWAALHKLPRQEWQALQGSSTSLPAPPQHAEEKRPELVVAPLLAFDRFGGRLGQGGGHYDRALAALRRTGPVFLLGLAFAGQEVDRLDLEPHDQPLDAVLTEAGYRRLPQA
jgi:hypothetical protein